jgi:hypothetical protein
MHRRPAPDLIAVVGKRLPPLVVTDPAGSTVDLAKLAQGRRTVIAFYSSSCHTCQVVLPELRPFPPVLELFLVSEEARISPGGPSVLGFDRALLFHDSNSVLSRSFPMSSLPTILFVDEQSVLRGGMVGGQRRDRVRTKLQEFVEGGL